MFQSLKQLGYKGYLSVECHGMENNYQTAKHEVEALSKMVEEIPIFRSS